MRSSPRSRGSPGTASPPTSGENDPLRHVFLGGTPEQQAQQRALFEQRRKLWQAWWSEHWREFVTREELRSVELPRRDEDLVEMAGVARYGVLFPTGANGAARSGPNVAAHPVGLLEREIASRLRHRTGFQSVRGNQDGGLGPAGRVRIANQRLVSAEWYRRSLPGSRRRRRSASSG